MAHQWKTAPRRVQIVVGTGGRNAYFKPGQYAYVIAVNTSGGMHFAHADHRVSKAGEPAYLVSKSKDMRGGALWFAKDALRFTGTRTRGTR